MSSTECCWSECSGGSGHSFGIWFQLFYLATLIIKCIQEKVLLEALTFWERQAQRKSHVSQFQYEVDFLCSLPMCMLLVGIAVIY